MVRPSGGWRFLNDARGFKSSGHIRGITRGPRVRYVQAPRLQTPRSMKVHCDVILDLDSGDYELTVNNLSQPGQPMDYLLIRRVLRRMFEDVDEQTIRLQPEDKAPSPSVR